MKRSFLLAGIGMLLFSNLFAQTYVPVTDTQPVTINGLIIGYRIKSQEVKAVSNKGDFSRYSVSFYVTNSTNEEKIILYKQGWNVLDNASDQLVQYKCLNATGARFTSKTATLTAPACNIPALVDDKDCASGKSVRNKRLVQIGYSIKAGQTISTDEIMIVPLNEPLNMQVAYVGSLLQPSGTATYGPPMANNQSMPPPSGYNFNPGDFVKIHNLSNDSFLNIEPGVAQSTAINSGWASAQWQVLQIPGSPNFNIRNKWKGNFLGVDRGYVTLGTNSQLPAAMWVMIQSQDPTIVRFKNAQTGGYLSIAFDHLVITPQSTNVMGADWRLERP